MIQIRWDFNSNKPTSDMTLYAVWEKAKVVVSFDTLGGSTISPVEIAVNGYLSSPVSPTKQDYSFDGWYTDNTFTTLWNFSTPITTNITLYTKWKSILKTFYVNFYYQGADGVSDTSSNITEGSYISQPITPTKTGYVFGGWYTSSSYTTLWNFSTNKVTNNVLLYAKWVANSYTVTFNSSSGSTVANQIVAYGDTITSPTTTRSGYTFDGWYTNSSYTTLWIFSNPITSNMTLYAKWTTIPTYTVTFNSSGGSSVSSQTVQSGSTITSPTTPTYTGYTFGGWYITLNTAYNFSTPITSNITLTAKWTAVAIPTYTVTFNTGGGSTVASKTVQSGTTITSPTSSWTGYTFGGWYTTSSYTSTFNFSTQITSNITLYAKWTAISYTVSFNTGSGSSVAPLSVIHGNTITEPATTYTGYVLSGWYTNSTYTTSFSFSTPITSNLTLYAKWTSSTVLATGITFTPTEPYIHVGQSTQMAATITPTNATDKTVSWKNYSKFVNVDTNGLVTGLYCTPSTYIYAISGDGNYAGQHPIRVYSKYWTEIDTTSISTGTNIVSADYICNMSSINSMDIFYKASATATTTTHKRFNLDLNSTDYYKMTTKTSLPFAYNCSGTIISAGDYLYAIACYGDTLGDRLRVYRQNYRTDSTWTRMNDLPYNSNIQIGLSNIETIGTDIYIVSGKIVKLDTLTDTWTIENTPLNPDYGLNLYNPIVTAIGNNIFIMGGTSSSSGTGIHYGYNYKWDTLNNTLEKLIDLPLAPFLYSCRKSNTFIVGDILYMLFSSRVWNDDINGYLDTSVLYQYNSVIDTWFHTNSGGIIDDGNMPEGMVLCEGNSYVHSVKTKYSTPYGLIIDRAALWEIK